MLKPCVGRNEVDPRLRDPVPREMRLEKKRVVGKDASAFSRGSSVGKGVREGGDGGVVVPKDVLLALEVSRVNEGREGRTSR